MSEPIDDMPRFDPHPILASVKHVVAEFGLSADTWRRLADSGFVRCLRIGNQRKFYRASCWDYIKPRDDLRRGGSIQGINREWARARKHAGENR
jgi:hypothetical protein